MRSAFLNKKIHRSRAFLYALLLFAIFTTVGLPSPSISIQLAPPVIEKLVKAGTSLKDTISFTNGGTIPLLVSVEISDFGVDERGRISDQAPETEPGLSAQQ